MVDAAADPQILLFLNHPYQPPGVIRSSLLRFRIENFTDLSAEVFRIILLLTCDYSSGVFSLKHLQTRADISRLRP